MFRGTIEDLASVVKMLQKKLEVCEHRIAVNEAETQRLKNDHKKEIGELRQQIKELQGSKASDSKVVYQIPSSSKVYSFPSKKIALQGCHQNWFVSARPDGSVECNKKNIGGWETIT